MKNENGITIIALVITIIIMMIIAGIGIGNLSGERSNINIASKQVLLYELTEVQQAVLETYLTYKQTQGQTNLYGTKITEWQTVRDLVQTINEEVYNRVHNYDKFYINDEDMGILKSEYDSNIDEKCYYEINKNDLKKMGFENIDLESIGLEKDEDTTTIFIVNYYTGEVFNIVVRATEDGTPLYVRAN